MKIDGSIAAYRSAPAAFIRVWGPDACVFLQGQFSNDVRRLSAGESRYGLWLNHKGKVLADSTIVKGEGDEFWLVSRESPAAVIQKRLEAYIIADDVEVQDVTPLWRSALLVGPGVQAWLSAEVRPGFVVASRLARGDAREWLYPAADDGQVGALLAGCRALDATDVERLRIEGCVASVPRDIGEGDLPNEGGLEEDAVAYDKGCYLGQEVMARLKAKGRVRRHLVAVTGPGDPPSLPASLYQSSKRVGELRSAVSQRETGFVGLALLGMSPFDSSLPLGLEAGADGGIRVLETSEK